MWLIGKTIASCVEALKTMLKYPGSEGLVGRYTDRELRQTTWKEFIDIVPPVLVEEINRAQLTCRLVNGSLVHGMHLQNEERLRSLSLDWALIDEACEVSETIFNQLLARLRGPIGPRRIWLTGNPEGHNWIYRKFVEPWGRGDEAPGHAYFQGRTVDVSFLPRDYIEALYEAYDEDWANRFIQGSWEVFQGQVYPMFDRSMHVLPADFRIPKEWPRHLGVDHGWTDPCAAVWVAVDPDGNHYVYEDYYRKLTVIEDNAKAILERSGGTQFVYRILAPFSDKTEPGRGKKYSEIYRDAGLHLVEQRSRVMSGIARVRELLQPRDGRKHPTQRHATAAPKLYITSNCHATIREFQAYRFPPVKDETSSPEKPLDKDNHLMDAIRAVVMFNPNAPEEKEDGTWEDWFDKLMSDDEGAKPEHRQVIGNERCLIGRTSYR